MYFISVLDKISSSPLQSWVNKRIISSGAFFIVISAINNDIMSIIFNLSSTLKGFPFPFPFASCVVAGHKVFLLLAVFVFAKALRWLWNLHMHYDCIQQSCDSTDLSIVHRLQYLERMLIKNRVLGLMYKGCKTRKFTSVVSHWNNTLYNTGNLKILLYKVDRMCRKFDLELHSHRNILVEKDLSDHQIQPLATFSSP